MYNEKIFAQEIYSHILSYFPNHYFYEPKEVDLCEIKYASNVCEWEKKLHKVED